MRPNLFTNGKAALEYTLAGNATLTLSSQETGNRFTFRVRAPREGNPNMRFLSLMTGPDNERSYSYLGLIRDGMVVLTAKSKMPAGSLPLRAWNYFMSYAKLGQIAPKLEVRHEGKCGRCGRKLTTPISIDRGIGPECWKHFGG